MAGSLAVTVTVTVTAAIAAAAATTAVAVTIAIAYPDPAPYPYPDAWRRRHHHGGQGEPVTVCRTPGRQAASGMVRRLPPIAVQRFRRLRMRYCTGSAGSTRRARWPICLSRMTLDTDEIPMVRSLDLGTSCVIGASTVAAANGRPRLRIG